MSEPNKFQDGNFAERRFPGRYRGRVKDVCDPECLGRVKCQVPEVLGMDILTDWAWPCIAKGTKIPLVDGSLVPVEDLVGRKEFWVYSCTQDGHVTIGRGHDARMTKRAKCFEIMLDNGMSFRATEDHPVMRRDGAFSFVRDLHSGDSLMPFYCWPLKKRNQQYLVVRQNYARGRTEFAHKIVARDIMGIQYRREYVIHHRDFDALNNVPTNLEEMEIHAHRELHSKIGRENMRRNWADLEYRKRMKENGRVCMAKGQAVIRAGLLKFLAECGIKRRAWAEEAVTSGDYMKMSSADRLRARKNLSPEMLMQAIKMKKLRPGRRTLVDYWGRQSAERCRANALHASRAAAKKIANMAKEERSEMYARGAKTREVRLAAMGTEERCAVEERRKDNLVGWWKNLSKEERLRINEKRAAAQRKRWGQVSSEDRKKWSQHLNSCHKVELNNHKIVSIIAVGEEDVYDISVDKHCNFALECGVFVHNCNSNYGGLPDYGDFRVPEVESTVLVEFESGDVNRPMYSSVWWGVPQKEGEDPKPPEPPMLTREAKKTCWKDDESVGLPKGEDKWQTADCETICQPRSPLKMKGYPKYPFNHVLKTIKNKLIIEIDDTPDQGRFHVWHGPSKSWVELDKDGELSVRIADKTHVLFEGDERTHCMKNQHEYVEGKKTERVGDERWTKVVGNELMVNFADFSHWTLGNRIDVVFGNYTQYVMGNFTAHVFGVYERIAAGQIFDKTGATIHHQSGGPSTPPDPPSCQPIGECPREPEVFCKDKPC